MERYFSVICRADLVFSTSQAPLLNSKKHLKCNKQMCFVSHLLLLMFVVSLQDEHRRAEAVRPAPVNMVNRPCGGGRCPTTAHR